jgi:hypothetical protein
MGRGFCTHGRDAYKICVGKPEGKYLREDLGVDGQVMVDCILGNRVRRCGLDSSGLGQGPVAGSCEDGNEPSGSIKDGAFLD